MCLSSRLKTLFAVTGLLACVEPVVHAELVENSRLIALPGKRILYADLAVVDFNGDGYKEIVAGGTDGILYVIGTTDGRNWRVLWSTQVNDYIEAANPPTSKDDNEIAAAPAVADLNGDGHKEIVVPVGREIAADPSIDTNGGVLVFTYTGAWSFSLIESLSADGSQGWPQPRIDRNGKHPGAGSPDGYWDAVMTSPALADLDGDGDLEIVVDAFDRRIYAWHHNGKAVDGWPIYRDNGDALVRSGTSSPAVADIDQDGLPEVIVATHSPYWDQSQPITSSNPNYNTATIWAWNGDSSVVPGFPIITEQWVYSSPAIADIDQDGQQEIVIGSGWGIDSGRQNTVFVYNHDGTISANWPQLTKGTTPASPSLADIDGDGQLEILIGCGSKYWTNDCGDGNAHLYAWNADGSSVSGFPTTVDATAYADWASSSDSMPFAPVVADIDGDSKPDILVVNTRSSGVSIVGSNGQLTGKRQISEWQHGLYQAPVVDDIDRDGKLEIIVGGGLPEQGMIFIWDEEGPATTQPWPMSRLNLLRSGTNLKDMAARLPSAGQVLPFIVPLLLDDIQRGQ